jgi:hypothetical protein
MNPNTENIFKHLEILQFMDTNKLNSLLAHKSGNRQNDFLKDHKWYKVNDTNLWVHAYEDAGKKYVARTYISDDNDTMGIKSAESYGGKKSNNRKIQKKDTIEPQNKSPVPKKKRQSQPKNNSDYSSDLMGDFRNINKK